MIALGCVLAIAAFALVIWLCETLERP